MGRSHAVKHRQRVKSQLSELPAVGTGHRPENTAQLAIHRGLLLFDIFGRVGLQKTAVQPGLVENVGRAGHKQRIVRADHGANQYRWIHLAPVESDGAQLFDRQGTVLLPVGDAGFLALLMGKHLLPLVAFVHIAPGTEELVLQDVRLCKEGRFTTKAEHVVFLVNDQYFAGRHVFPRLHPSAPSGTGRFAIEPVTAMVPGGIQESRGRQKMRPLTALIGCIQRKEF